MLLHRALAQAGPFLVLKEEEKIPEKSYYMERKKQGNRQEHAIHNNIYIDSYGIKC